MIIAQKVHNPCTKMDTESSWVLPVVMSERIVGPGFHEKVYRIVRRVPRGRLTTYGDIAEALGDKRVARHVGFALAALPDARIDVPWHRVVSSSGHISIKGFGQIDQKMILAGEGVEVGPSGRIYGFAALRVPVKDLVERGSRGKRRTSKR